MVLRPVKVTAWLCSPLALSPEGVAPRLDAVVEWSMSNKMRTIHEDSGGRHSAEFVRPRGKPIEKPGQIPIPIERKFVAGLPIPMCSDGIFVGNERVEHYSCKFPNEMAAMLADDERVVMRSGGGVYKSWHLPLRIVDCDCVVWFAMIRDKKTRLRHELKRVQYIGKKTPQGYGQVEKWDVEDADKDYSWWADGVLMRPLPVGVDIPDGARGYRPSFGGVCPPYWQRDFWREMITPC